MRLDPVTALFSGRPWSAGQQPSLGGWSFDPVSFVIGLLTALVLVGLIFRHRGRIVGIRERAKAKAAQLRERLTTSMATRYCEAVIETAQTQHLFGALGRLDDIYVEIQLYAPLASEENTVEPLSLSPQQAVRASNRLCIVGGSGSGRTTLLQRLLLHYAGRVITAGDRERVPLYVHLPALASELTADTPADTDAHHSNAPTQQLVGITLASMSRLVAAGAARWLRRQVESGNTLILLDSWDELPAPQIAAATAWLQELIAIFPGNHLLVAAGERGYAPLMEAGLAPLRIRPWTHQQLVDLAQRWSAVWASREGQETESPPALTCALAPPTPLEATIELLIQLRGQTPAHTPAGKMAQVLDLLLPQPATDGNGQAAWPPETGHRALGHLALATMTRGRPTLAREQIQAVVTESMPPPQFAVDQEQEVESSHQELKAAREEQERRTLQIVDCCRALTAVGAPIRAWDNQRYYFAHPSLTAFLMARHLVAEDGDFTPSASDPARSDVLRYYVGLAPAGPVVARLLSSPDDLLLSRLWSATGLLAATPPDDALWRADLIKRLAQLFMNARVPHLLRDRALKALVDSHETGVSLLFRRAVGNPDPHLRAGAILGLGALGRVDDLRLIADARGDESATVRLAAVNALSMLARMGSEPALELIVATMVEAEDQVQRVAAEALAGLGAEGRAVLREGLTDHDLIVRRAAVYGLSTINEDWARGLLEEVQREDDEWLVRNAAAEALDRMGKQENDGPPLDLALPQAEAEPWLITWAAEQGVGTGVGDAALATLLRALTEGNLATRQRAIDTLRRLGDPRTIDALKQTLRASEPSLRQAALRALDEISRRHDLSITTG